MDQIESQSPIRTLRVACLWHYLANDEPYLCVAVCGAMRILIFYDKNMFDRLKQNRNTTLRVSAINGLQGMLSTQQADESACFYFLLLPDDDLHTHDVTLHKPEPSSDCAVIFCTLQKVAR